MKKNLKKVLAVVCVLAILSAGCEYPDGSIGLWNWISLAVAGLTGWWLNRESKFQEN